MFEGGLPFPKSLLGCTCKADSRQDLPSLQHKHESTNASIKEQASDLSCGLQYTALAFCLSVDNQGAGLPCSKPLR